MSSKLLILALTCVAMSHLASADVSPTLCDDKCDLKGMKNASKTTIKTFINVLGHSASWLIRILNGVLDKLLTNVVVALATAILIVGSTTCIGLLNLILTIISLLVDIILRWLDGHVTTNQCRILITNWYKKYFSRIYSYSTDSALMVVIDECLTIIMDLKQGCLSNVI